MDTGATSNLLENVRQFVAMCHQFHVFNWWLSWLITVVALGCTAGVVAAGLYDHAKLASILGLIAGVLVAYDKFDPSGEKAQFYRELRAEASNLELDLGGSPNDETIRRVTEQLKVLRLTEAKSYPRGEGMAVVRKLSHDLGKVENSLPNS